MPRQVLYQVYSPLTTVRLALSLPRHISSAQEMRGLVPYLAVICFAICESVRGQEKWEDNDTRITYLPEGVFFMQ